MSHPDLARVAAALGDPSRAAIVQVLQGGTALPHGELAAIAGIAPSTASEHLARLLDAGILVRIAQGRHRYYRLAGADVAEVIERLAAIAPPGDAPRSLRDSERLRTERFARTCYDHLAGALGVAVCGALVTRGALVVRDDAFVTTAEAEGHFSALGVDLAPLRAQRRPLVRTCLDWSERRPHLAGALGAALADAFLAHGWLRRAADHRGLHVTPQGETALARALRLDVRSREGRIAILA